MLFWSGMPGWPWLMLWGPVLSCIRGKKYIPYMVTLCDLCTVMTLHITFYFVLRDGYYLLWATEPPAKQTTCACYPVGKWFLTVDGWLIVCSQCWQYTAGRPSCFSFSICSWWEVSAGMLISCYRLVLRQYVYPRKLCFPVGSSLFVLGVFWVNYHSGTHTTSVYLESEDAFGLRWSHHKHAPPLSQIAIYALAAQTLMTRARAVMYAARPQERDCGQTKSSGHMGQPSWHS